MKIDRIQIENYGSLRELPLDMENLTVLIGRNGSGKSFILEALYKFFSEFSATGGVSSGLSDYIWHDRDTTHPIKFTVTLKLDEKEIKNFFPFPREILNFLKKKFGQKYCNLEICRSIDLRAGWKTDYIKWGDMYLIKDDEALPLSELNKLLFPEIPLANFMFYFFAPGYSSQKIGGDRIFIDLKKKVAYTSNPQIDSLVAAEVIRASTETAGLNWKEWAKQQGYSIVGRPPKPDEIPEVLQQITADLLQKVIANFSTKTRGKFKLIPAARNIKATLGVRAPFLDTTTLDSLRTLSISTNRDDERKWNRFRSQVEPFISKGLEPNPTQLLIREFDLRHPPANVGGGEQEILSLMWYLSEEDVIFGIEEPENHLHAELSRRLFGFIKKLSTRNQIILATHSPIFVDKIDIGNNWIVWREGKVSKAKRVENRDEFKLILAELGVVPSDIYLKDFIFFVEGGTEKEAILPIFAQRLGLDMGDRVGIIAVGGDPNVRNYLRIWLELMRYAPIDYLVILDEHSKDLVIELARDMDIDIKKFSVLKKGSIEDYYPINIVVDAINELFGLKITKDDIDPDKPRDKEIQRVLEANEKIRKRWKIEIGEYAAEKMLESDIPEEISRAIKFVKDHVLEAGGEISID